MKRVRGLVFAGIVLAVLGLAGIAMPVFTTEHTKNLAKVGDLKLQTTEEATHVIPPILSQGLLALGAVLIGAGLFLNRRT